MLRRSHGCFKISGIEIRILVSTMSMRMTRSFSSCESGLKSRGFSYGNLNYPEKITYFSSRIFYALKGTVPVTIAYRRTPMPHISDLNPL